MDPKGALPDSTGDDELTMEQKGKTAELKAKLKKAGDGELSVEEKQKAKTAVLKPKSLAFKLKKKAGDDELTMEQKLALVQEEKAKTAVLTAELKANSRALKLKKKAGEAAKEAGVIVPFALYNADDEDGPPEEITNEEAIAKHLKLEMSIAASASARVNPFNESTQYLDWLKFEKTHRGLSPAEEQYLVTASLAGHVFNKRNLP